MANQWLRLWHDMPNDPKWRTIARLSGQPIALVMSVYINILVLASSNKSRGTIENLRIEDVASALDVDDEAVVAVVSAMEGRVIQNGGVLGWAIRQPEKEDGAEKSRVNDGDGSNYVYFVATTGNDVVKIGISRNPWSRIKDLQAGSASKFELLAAIKTAKRSEFEVHAFFEKTRLNGEWFGRSKALNLLINGIKSKQLRRYDDCLKLLDSLDGESFDLLRSNYRSDVVTTKDTDTDTELKEKPPLIPQQAGGLPSGDEAPKRQKRAAITFAQWLVAIREAGERPLSDYEALRRYMATVGLSEDFVGLAWVKFKERYGHDEKGRRKRYADWRAVFLRAVKENWFKLWFIDRDNGIQLTTIGKQADIEAAAEEGTA